MDNAKLSCRFLDFELKSPLVLASGIIAMARA